MSVRKSSLVALLALEGFELFQSLLTAELLERAGWPGWALFGAGEFLSLLLESSNSYVYERTTIQVVKIALQLG